MFLYNIKLTDFQILEYQGHLYKMPYKTSNNFDSKSSKNNFGVINWIIYALLSDVIFIQTVLWVPY